MTKRQTTVQMLAGMRDLVRAQTVGLVAALENEQRGYQLLAAAADHEGSASGWLCLADAAGQKLELQKRMLEQLDTLDVMAIFG